MALRFKMISLMALCPFILKHYCDSFHIQSILTIFSSIMPIILWMYHSYRIIDLCNVNPYVLFFLIVLILFVFYCFILFSFQFSNF